MRFMWSIHNLALCMCVCAFVCARTMAAHIRVSFPRFLPFKNAVILRYCRQVLACGEMLGLEFINSTCYMLSVIRKLVVNWR